jgi:hypothetical protein
MKRIVVLFSLITGLFCLSAIQAQTIIEDLETPRPGEGIIHIQCDPAIKALIGVSSAHINADETNYLKINGFRIQVFMGNNPKTAKGEAAHKEGLIRENFPEVTVHTTYQAPNWKVLVGDFTTKEEAIIFMQKIQKAFPDFGKEMYTVADKVNIPIQRSN